MIPHHSLDADFVCVDPPGASKKHRVCYFTTCLDNNEVQQQAEPELHSIVDLFWCGGCDEIIPRDPALTITEIDSYYCQHSLENIPSSEAMNYFNRSARVFGCPECTNVLVTIASKASTVAEFLSEKPDDEQADSLRYYLSCNYCRWDSLELGMIESQPEDLILNAIQYERNAPLEKSLGDFTQWLQGSLDRKAEATKKNTPLSAAGTHLNQHPWKLGHLNEHLATKSSQSAVLSWSDEQGRHALVNVADEVSPKETPLSPNAICSLTQRNANLATQPELVRQVIPQRVALRTKQSIRCRTCVKLGQPNILVKPQINPLKGDSSMRANVGVWFKKRSHAYNVLPRIIVNKVSDDQVYLLVTNPTDASMRITMEGMPWLPSLFHAIVPNTPVVVDAFDELDMIDQQWSKSPETASSELREDDNQDLVMARRHNQVLVNCKVGRIADAEELGEAPLGRHMFLKFSVTSDDEAMSDMHFGVAVAM